MISRRSKVLALVGSLALISLLAACSSSPLSGASNTRVQTEEGYGGTTGGGDYARNSDAVGGAGESANLPAAQEAAPPAPADGSVAVDQAAQQQDIQHLIIRTGQIAVAVDNTRDAQKNIEQMVNSMAAQGAFVVSSNVYGGSTDVSPSIDMVIRVPADRFDDVMNHITGLAAKGTVPTSSQSGQDVTEEYVDLQSRLKSLEAARDRLQQIMENAQTTEELLQAEQQLTAREAEIESIKGRMQFLEKSAALSSITISLQPYILSQPVDDRWRPAETVRRAFEALLESLRDVGDFLITVTIFCGPYLLVIVPLIWFSVRFVRNQLRKRRERRAAAAASTTNP